MHSATELIKMIAAKIGHRYLTHKVKDAFSAEIAFPMKDFGLNTLRADYSGYQQASRNRCNWHHYRVSKEIKEVQELHADDRYASQRAVTQRRQSAKCDHDHTDDQSCFFSVPVKLILESRNSTFCQSNRTGNGSKQYQQEENRCR